MTAVTDARVNLRRVRRRGPAPRNNRLSLWITQVRGFAVLPLQIVLHNDGAESVPDRYY